MKEKPNTTLEHSRLTCLLDYCPDSGAFRRKTGNKTFGSVAGSINEKGHRRISIKGQLFYAHRLAWFYVYGEWPNDIVDHINGDPDDNRIVNLRVASPWQNAANSRVAIGMWGLPGFHQQRSGRWQAQIRHRNKTIALGTFDTKEEAHAVYVAARKRLCGDFADRPERSEKIVPPPLVRGARPDISIERLRDAMEYSPDTGIFIWRKPRRKALIGTAVGCRHVQGYLTTCVDGRRYSVHVLAWLWVHGYLPTSRLDHINGIRDDNRIANLRLATAQGNSANSPGWKRTGIGLKGAYPARSNTKNPWFAAIRVNRRLIRIGGFPTELEAHRAYIDAARRHFGEFANAGHQAASLK